MTYHRFCGAYPSAAPEFYRFYTSLSGVRVVHAFSSILRYPVRFPCKNDVRFMCLDSHLLCGGFRFIYVNCIYLRILVSNTISISDDVRVV
jgi:hypothetical protein